MHFTRPDCGLPLAIDLDATVYGADRQHRRQWFLGLSHDSALKSRATHSRTKSLISVAASSTLARQSSGYSSPLASTAGKRSTITLTAALGTESLPSHAV